MIEVRGGCTVFIQIPVSATYRIENGDAVRQDANFVEVETDVVARFLADRFHILHDDHIDASTVATDCL